jgi:hypothetical protein
MSDGIRVQFAAFLAAGGLATATHWAVIAFLITVAVQPVTATAPTTIYEARTKLNTADTPLYIDTKRGRSNES